ncbi:MAG: DUF421 domain-containing protein [Phycisphaerales bacterium]
MDMLLRAVVMYVLVWSLFRLSGRRTMSEMTTFDFVLLLIIGEAVQQALLGEDYSLTNAAVVVLTLITLDRFVTILRARSRHFERIVEGEPLLIMANGVLMTESMRRERINESDILHAARQAHGIDSLHQIAHVILEPSGDMSVIPKRSAP